MRLSFPHCPLAPRGQFWSLALATAILTTGCAGVPRLGSPLGKGEASPDAAGPAIPVEMRDLGGKSQVKYVPFTEELHVSEALEKSGGLKRFGGREVCVIRTTPSGEKAKMSVQLSPNQRQVRAEHDYLLHSGDRVLVKESADGSMDNLMRAVLGPLSP